jgi:hypothetical protein
VSGLEQAVGILDASLPSLSESASALRSLTERLGSVAVVLANELPKATRSLQEVSPELASVVALLDDVVGTIPGMRRVFRATSSVPFEPS